MKIKIKNGDNEVTIFPEELWEQDSQEPKALKALAKTTRLRWRQRTKRKDSKNWKRQSQRFQNIAEHDVKAEPCVIKHLCSGLHVEYTMLNDRAGELHDYAIPSHLLNFVNEAAETEILTSTTGIYVEMERDKHGIWEWIAVTVA